MNGYETVILCGAVYASGIAGISYLRKNKNALAGNGRQSFVWERLLTTRKPWLM